MWKRAAILSKRYDKYDGERQVTKPSSPLQSCRLRFVRFTLHSCRSRSKAVAPATHKKTILSKSCWSWLPEQYDTK